MHVARRFERLLDVYRRPDGREWSGAELGRATGGAVTRSYTTNLRKRRIDNPGYEKMRAIAKAMDFPPESWFSDNPVVEAEHGVGSGVAERLERLFATIMNAKTGESYSNAEVARMSAGVLTEDDVEGIRNGSVADPSVSKVAALARVFGIEPSYFVDRGDALLLDAELAEALREEKVAAIARESACLPEPERQIVLGIVRQLGAEIRARTSEHTTKIPCR